VTRVTFQPARLTTGATSKQQRTNLFPVPTAGKYRTAAIATALWLRPPAAVYCNFIDVYWTRWYLQIYLLVYLNRLQLLHAFRDVAAIPDVGRLYALSVAPIIDEFRLPVPKCKPVPRAERALH